MRKKGSKATGKATGVASYCRIDPRGAIEVGHVHYSPLLQRSPAGTEARRVGPTTQAADATKANGAEKSGVRSQAE